MRDCCCFIILYIVALLLPLMLSQVCEKTDKVWKNTDRIEDNKDQATNLSLCEEYRRYFFPQSMLTHFILLHRHVCLYDKYLVRVLDCLCPSLLFTKALLCFDSKLVC